MSDLTNSVVLGAFLLAIIILSVLLLLTIKRCVRNSLSHPSTRDSANNYRVQLSQTYAQPSAVARMVANPDGSLAVGVRG